MTTQHTDIVYIVVEDFGSLGRSYLETDEKSAGLSDVINDMINGEFDRPVRIVAFDPGQCDVSAELAQKIADAAWTQDIELPKAVRRFCENHGANVPEVIRTAR